MLIRFRVTHNYFMTQIYAEHVVFSLNYYEKGAIIISITYPRTLVQIFIIVIPKFQGAVSSGLHQVGSCRFGQLSGNIEKNELYVIYRDILFSFYFSKVVSFCFYLVLLIYCCFPWVRAVCTRNQWKRWNYLKCDPCYSKPTFSVEFPVRKCALRCRFCEKIFASCRKFSERKGTTYVELVKYLFQNMLQMCVQIIMHIAAFTRRPKFRDGVLIFNEFSGY